MPTAEESACPRCEAPPGALLIHTVLEGKPLGTFSLAGSQMKVSARLRPVLSCRECAWNVLGEFDGRHAVFPPPDGQDADLSAEG